MSSSKSKREFNDLIKNNKIHRFVTQLQYCKDPVEVKKIKEILSNLQLVTSDVTNNPDGKLKEYLKTIDDYQYRKQWNRLKDFQKEDRLVKFMDDKKLSKTLCTELMELHEKGDLKSTKDVEYDHLNGKLKGITRLEKTDEGDYVIKKINKKKSKSPSRDEVDDVPESKNKKLKKPFNKVKKVKKTSSSDESKTKDTKRIKKVKKTKK